MQPGPSAKNDKIEQRVAAEPICPVKRDARTLASRIKPRHGVILHISYVAVGIYRDASHHVVTSGMNWNLVCCRVKAEVNFYKRRNIRKPFGQFFFSKLGEVQIDKVLSIYSPALLNLGINRAGNHVPWGQVLDSGSVPFHEPLALTIA